ncbi:MAG: Flavodoxin reductases (ferredoxin-NADPH reductases) family 1, partial [uncultured Nocardioidaceae bacterium]
DRDDVAARRRGLARAPGGAACRRPPHRARRLRRGPPLLPRLRGGVFPGRDHGGHHPGRRGVAVPGPHRPARTPRGGAWPPRELVRLGSHRLLPRAARRWRQRRRTPDEHAAHASRRRSSVPHAVAVLGRRPGPPALPRRAAPARAAGRRHARVHAAGPVREHAPPGSADSGRAGRADPARCDAARLLRLRTHRLRRDRPGTARRARPRARPTPRGEVRGEEHAM